MKIYCCGCESEVKATLVSGMEIYPFQYHLAHIPFWECPKCRNYVGCHHKSANRTKPLGVIPTPEIRTQRAYIHQVLDPIWQEGYMSRKEVYKMLSDHLGEEYHTANLKTEYECIVVNDFVRKLYHSLVKEKGA